jgi:hypothetical protein
LLIFTIKSLSSACHDSLNSLIQNLGIWIQGSRAAAHVLSATYFLNYFSNVLQDKDKRPKIKLTLSLILRANLRLEGYSICSASLIAPHIMKTGQLLGAWAPHSLDAAKEVLEGQLQDKVRENSKMPLEVLEHLLYSATKSSGACQTRAQGTVHVAQLS